MADTDEDIEKAENLPQDDKIHTVGDLDSNLNNEEEGEGDDDEGEDADYNEDSDTRKTYKKYIPVAGYDSSKHISGPVRVENGTVPIDVLEFYHSYAYDCRKYFNLCVADPNTIIFASGNWIHFFDVSDNKIWFRRGSTGGGIGHITKNPVYAHIAVGENGVDPPISVYNWPSMELVTVLVGGTSRCYSRLAYSRDGELLVSQGGHPDHLITVWNWQRSEIVLRCKSHGQDVYNAMFSPSVAGHLTTSGTGHIKFWKMARTFTGLKLQGELGRFGKTEISDIVGVYPMPDEKVVSGCEWGNILLWEEGLVKLEVCRKNRQRCHDKPITQFEYINGELVSVGMDGRICVWYYETIDQADPPDDDRFLEIQPIYEFHIARGRAGEESVETSMLMSIQKQEPDDPEKTVWYAQDGNGGLWTVDLNTLKTPEPPRIIFTCHAGPIVDMDVSEWGPFAVTIGTAGRMHVYNYIEKRLVLVHKFRDAGSQVVWLPCKVDSSGSTIVCAFGSGIIRVLAVAVALANAANDIEGDYVRLVQVLRAHTVPITVMSFNSISRLLVTGSEDATVFAFSVESTDSYPSLNPIGYVKVASSVACVAWKPENDTTLLVGCTKGDCAEIRFPEEPQAYTTVSYELVRSRSLGFKFHSVKSSIRREMVRLDREKKKEEKLAKKLAEMEQLKDEHPGIEIDEEAFLMDSEEEPPLPDIYVPELPNRVLIARYTNRGTIWLSMAGFDAGYMYEYPVPEAGKVAPKEPIRSTPIYHAEDCEIRSCLYYKRNKYLFLGMERGEIRICRLKEEDHTDLSDYWILATHDNYNGYIPKMLTSHDRRMLLTCGHDGNLFSYVINDDTPPEEVDAILTRPAPPLPSVVEDIEERDYPTLEEAIVRKEYSRLVAAAKERKDATLDALRKLTEEYGKIVDRNRGLPRSQQIPRNAFELDPRITADLDQQLKAEMDLVRAKLTFKVEKSRLGLQKLMEYFIEPITCVPFAVCQISNPEKRVHSLRERKLDEDFASVYDEVARRVKEEEKTEQEDERTEQEQTEEVEERKMQKTESFLRNLTLSTIEYKLGVQVNHMLRKYRARRARLESREKEWKAIHAKKPDPSLDRPDDANALAEARRTLGDHKLKASPTFAATATERRDTTLSKHKQLLERRRALHRLREDFNDKLRAMRARKQRLQADVLRLIETLKKIHAEIPPRRVRPLPSVPVIDNDVEFPEKNLELDKYTSMAERVKQAKRQRLSLVQDELFDIEDEEHEVLLLDEKMLQPDEGDSLSAIVSASERRLKVQSIVQVDTLHALCTSDRVQTAWEREMKRSRATRKLYEQDCVLRHVERSYRDYDRELEQMERERLDIVAEGVYVELFILTLHQEYIVLRDYEAMENALADKVNRKIAERSAAKQKIQSTNSRIEQKTKEIAKLQERIKELFAEYIGMISDNKFYSFLRRIFKKRYKPPKADDESTSSSTSSSESSTDDDNDAATADSREIEAIHFDESICPAGCDQGLYEMAFSQREKRYELESLVKEGQKTIEILHKEVENDTKKLKLVENALRANEEELTAFMLEKQQKLNDIDATVILRFHQIQRFTDSGAAKIRDCVVFDKATLSRLYSRIGELQRETLDLYAKHKKNRTHLHRMKVDCKHMQGEIKRITDEIKREMFNKFGQEVSLSTLYETVLRRMIYQIRADLSEMASNYDRQIKCVKDNCSEELVTLESLIQDNTEKMSFLTILEEEQLKLRKMLKQTPASEEDMAREERRHERDIKRLERIIEKQEGQMRAFRNDIKNLGMKTRPLAPICAKPREARPRGAAAEDSGETTAEAEENRSESDGGGREEEGPITDERSEVHRLLSRFVEASLQETESPDATQGILKELVTRLMVAGDLDETYRDIEQSLDRISDSLPERDAATIQAIREALRETLRDIVQRLKAEPKVESTQVLSSDIGERLIELLKENGVEITQEMQTDVIRQALHAKHGEAAATRNLLEDALTDVDEQRKIDLRQAISTILSETFTQSTDGSDAEEFERDESEPESYDSQ